MKVTVFVWRNDRGRLDTVPKYWHEWGYDVAHENEEIETSIERAWWRVIVKVSAARCHVDIETLHPKTVEMMIDQVAKPIEFPKVELKLRDDYYISPILGWAGR